LTDKLRVGFASFFKIFRRGRLRISLRRSLSKSSSEKWREHIRAGKK
jgi:hypothetical protein